MADNKPAHEIRMGRVKATIWANKTERGTRFSVSVQKLYKAEEGWKSTSSLGREDIPLAQVVLARTLDWMYGQTK